MKPARLVSSAVGGLRPPASSPICRPTVGEALGKGPYLHKGPYVRLADVQQLVISQQLSTVADVLTFDLWQTDFSMFEITYVSIFGDDDDLT